MSVKKYVPRHERLGCSTDFAEFVISREITRNIPLLDSNGELVSTVSQLQVVPACDVMDKYKLSDFRLSNLLEAGVPLSEVNVNFGSSVQLDELDAICQKMDAAEAVVAARRAEIEASQSWLNPQNSNNDGN